MLTESVAVLNMDGILSCRIYVHLKGSAVIISDTLETEAVHIVNKLALAHMDKAL